VPLEHQEDQILFFVVHHVALFCLVEFGKQFVHCVDKQVGVLLNQYQQVRLLLVVFIHDDHSNLFVVALLEILFLLDLEVVELVIASVHQLTKITGLRAYNFSVGFKDFFEFVHDSGVVFKLSDLIWPHEIIFDKFKFTFR